jgi:hypothetical protein
MNSSFRKYGGLNYASSNNIVRNHYCNNDNLTISDKIGLLNSKILNESHIDMSGNSILGVKDIYFYNGSVFNGTSGGDLLSSNNTFTGSNTFTVIPTAPTPTPSGATSSQIATVGYVQSVIPSSSNYALLNNSNTFTNGTTQTFYVASFNGVVTFNQPVTCNSSITATSVSATSVSVTTVNTSSDYRIKENVIELNESYSVDNLRPVEYENKITNKQSLGFIAHEVQEQYPFLVTGEKDGKEIQSINYQEIIPILVKEIQDLKKRVTILEN